MKLPLYKSEMTKYQQFHMVYCNIRKLDLGSIALGKLLFCSSSKLDLGNFSLEQQPLSIMNEFLKSMCLQTSTKCLTWNFDVAWAFFTYLFSSDLHNPENEYFLKFCSLGTSFAST